MKRLIGLLTVVVFLFSLVACSTVEISKEKNNVENTSSIEKDIVSEVSSTETTVSEKETIFETPCTWELGEFKDEFEQPTGEKYIITETTDGKFSNSATTDSRLTAAVQVLNDGIDIFLLEYGSNYVKGTFDENYYNISVLDESGDKHAFRGVIYQGGDRVSITSGQNSMLSLLKKEQKLKIFIEEDSEYTNSTYLFDIDTSGFADLYSKTF